MIIPIDKYEIECNEYSTILMVYIKYCGSIETGQITFIHLCFQLDSKEFFCEVIDYNISLIHG